MIPPGVRELGLTDPVVMALARGGVVEISTRGRRTGRDRRVELTLHNVDRRLILSGRPGKRDWYANLVAHPEFTLRVRSVDADVPAVAHPVLDWSERRRLMQRVMVKGFGFAPERATREIDLWVTRSPLVVVEVTWPEWVNA